MICKWATNSRQNDKIKRGAERPFFGMSLEATKRLENWNERRALARPYFLRSTTRESRVRNPPRFKTPRRSGSKAVSALEMPWRTAPAWPDSPPPDTVQTMSY